MPTGLFKYRAQPSLVAIWEASTNGYWTFTCCKRQLEALLGRKLSLDEEGLFRLTIDEIVIGPLIALFLI